MSQYQYLGSHEREPIGDVGICLRGNPVSSRSKRFDALVEEYEHIYQVQVKHTAHGKFYRVLAKVGR